MIIKNLQDIKKTNPEFYRKIKRKLNSLYGRGTAGAPVLNTNSDTKCPQDYTQLIIDHLKERKQSLNELLSITADIHLLGDVAANHDAQLLSWLEKETKETDEKIMSYVKTIFPSSEIDTSDKFWELIQAADRREYIAKEEIEKYIRNFNANFKYPHKLTKLIHEMIPHRESVYSEDLLDRSLKSHLISDYIKDNIIITCAADIKEFIKCYAVDCTSDIAKIINTMVSYGIPNHAYIVKDITYWNYGVRLFPNKIIIKLYNTSFEYPGEMKYPVLNCITNLGNEQKTIGIEIND